MATNKMKSVSFKQIMSFGIVAGVAMLMSGHASFALTSHTLAQQLASMEAERSTRLAHAQELLGTGYSQSIANSSSSVVQIREFIYGSTKKELKGKWKMYSPAVASTILEQAHQFGFDPIFLMAVIENESSFNPSIVGSHGEVGLMQITPVTAQWISEKYGVTYKGKGTLFDPVSNIKIGAAYLSFLRGKYNFKSKLYLSAYNMGATCLKRALSHRKIPHQYVSHVMERYVRFYSEIRTTPATAKTLIASRGF